MSCLLYDILVVEKQCSLWSTLLCLTVPNAGLGVQEFPQAVLPMQMSGNESSSDGSQISPEIRRMQPKTTAVPTYQAQYEGYDHQDRAALMPVEVTETVSVTLGTDSESPRLPSTSPPSPSLFGNTVLSNAETGPSDLETVSQPPERVADVSVEERPRLEFAVDKPHYAVSGESGVESCIHDAVLDTQDTEFCFSAFDTTIDSAQSTPEVSPSGHSLKRKAETFEFDDNFTFEVLVFT